MSPLGWLGAFLYSAALIAVVAAAHRDDPARVVAARAVRLFFGFVLGIAAFAGVIVLLGSLA